MFGDQPDGKAGGSRKKKDAEEDRQGGQEADFVDEKELKGALQLGVLRTADSMALRVGGRNGLDMEFSEEVVNQVAAIVWDTVADNWAEDLARFSVHAGRQKVNMDDISLLTRRNPDLIQAACKMAGVEYQEAGGQKTGKGRKRKKDDPPPLAASKESKPSTEEEITVIQDENLQTPKSHLKKAKLQSEQPPRNRATSTPKTAERTLRFPDDITPIRPTDIEVFSSNHANLSAIDEEKTVNETRIGEEEENDEQDSFDIFGETRKDDSTKTITNTNMSSLLKQAEEHHSSVVESTKDRFEHERLERMVPKEEEFDNDSVDSFDNYNAKEVEKSLGTPKNAVFSNKMSSFAFDDDDSFDTPVEEIPKKTPKTSTSTRKEGPKDKSIVASTPKSSAVSKRSSRTLQLDHDSFDEFDFDI